MNGVIGELKMPAAGYNRYDQLLLPLPIPYAVMTNCFPFFLWLGIQERCIPLRACFSSFLCLAFSFFFFLPTLPKTPLRLSFGVTLFPLLGTEDQGIEGGWIHSIWLNGVCVWHSVLALSTHSPPRQTEKG